MDNQNINESYYEMNKRVYKDWSPEKIEELAKKFSKLSKGQINKKLKTIEYEMKEVNYCLNKTQDEGKIKSVLKTALCTLSFGTPIPRSAEPKHMLTAAKKGYEVQRKALEMALKMKEETKNESFLFENNIDFELEMMLEDAMIEIYKKF